MNKLEKLGLGTAAIGRPLYININKSGNSQELSLKDFMGEGEKLINEAYKLGIRYFDTAPGYGIAEKMLMNGLSKKSDPSIEIATKWGYTYVADFKPNAVVHEVKEHSLEKLDEQWDFSKKMFPRLTSYQIHSATFETGVLKNMHVLNRLSALKHEYGLFIGITTTGENQVDVIEKALEVKTDGHDLFDLFQVTYNVFDQSIIAISSELESRNKRLVIKEALANGRVFRNTNYPHYSNSYNVLETIARKYNVGVDAVALRFCIDSLPLYKVLSGAASLEHLSDNLKISNFKLDKEDLMVLKDLAILPSEYWKERKLLGWN